jgi:hypothetical protein
MNLNRRNEKVSFIKWYYGGSSLRKFEATFASGFADRPIPAIETIRRIVEKFEHLMKDTFLFILYEFI